MDGFTNSDWKGKLSYGMTDYDRAVEDFNSRGDKSEYVQWYLREFEDRDISPEDIGDLELLVERSENNLLENQLSDNYWIIPRNLSSFQELLLAGGYEPQSYGELPIITNREGITVAQVKGMDNFHLSPDEINIKNLKSYLLAVDEFRSFLHLNRVPYTFDEEGFDQISKKLKQDAMEKIKDDLEVAELFSKENNGQLKFVL